MGEPGSSDVAPVFLNKPWTAPPQGKRGERPIKALSEWLANLRDGVIHRRYYAPVIYVLQSSGVGKSYVIKETGRTLPLFFLCLRDAVGDGFPPPDPPIKTYFSIDVPTKVCDEEMGDQDDYAVAWWHLTALCVIHAILQEVLDWIKGIEESQQREKLRTRLEELNEDADWLTNMEPFKRNVFDTSLVTTIRNASNSPADFGVKVKRERTNDGADDQEATPTKRQKRAHSTPPAETRYEVMTRIAGRANKLRGENWKSRWVKLFLKNRPDNQDNSQLFWDKTTNPTTLKHPLLQATRNLATLIPQPESGDKYAIPLAIAFDEISTLQAKQEANSPTQSKISTESQKYGPLYALTRVWTIFRPYQEDQKPLVWAIYAATLGLLYALNPDRKNVVRNDLRLESGRRYKNDVYLQYPPFHTFCQDVYPIDDHVLYGPPTDWVSPDNIFKLGRPLWYPYRHLNEDARIQFVWNKIHGRYSDSRNVQTAFAVLSYLVILDDPVLTGSNFDFLRDPVNGHLRYCTKLDFEKSTIETRTFSDPPCAQNLSYYMRRKGPGNFVRLIDTVTSRLLVPGTHKTGELEKLLVRLTLVYARIFIGRPFNPTKRGYETSYNDPEWLRDEFFDLWFKARDFLRYWLLPDISEEELDEKLKPETGFRSLLDNGYMNFTHFWTNTQTGWDVSPKNFKKLLHLAMFRSAAIMVQATYDFMDLYIPLYTGDITQTFQLDKITVFAIQIKLKANRLTPYDMFGGLKNSTQWLGRVIGEEPGGQTIPKDQRRSGQSANTSAYHAYHLDIFQNDSIVVCLNFGRPDRSVDLYKHVPDETSSKRIWGIWVEGSKCLQNLGQLSKHIEATRASKYPVVDMIFTDIFEDSEDQTSSHSQVEQMRIATDRDMQDADMQDADMQDADMQDADMQDTESEDADM